MKLITAIIKPFKLDDVREAIANLGVEGLTASVPARATTKHCDPAPWSRWLSPSSTQADPAEKENTWSWRDWVGFHPVFLF